MPRRRPPFPLFPALALATTACAAGDSTGGGDVLVVATITISPPGASLTVGQTQAFSAQAVSSSGVPVPNRTVTWSTGDPAVASISTAGVVTAHAEGGPVTITARVDGVAGTAQVTVAPRPVASVLVEPPQAELLIGQAVRFEATPRDAQGTVLPGRPVTWISDHPTLASVGGDGTVVGVAQGITTIRALVGGQAGTATVAVIGRPAARLGFVTGPSTGVAGQMLPPVDIAVQDEVGGTVPGATTAITVAMADNPGGSALGGTLTVNAVNGVATFQDLVLQQAASGYTLRATADLLGQALSAPFAIAPAAASTLALTTPPPATAVSGIPLTRSPAVQVRDAYGNAVSQPGVPVTVALNGAGATLGGTLTVVTDGTGAALFPDLTLTGQAGSYFLHFTAPGLVGATSQAVTLGAATPVRLAVVTAPPPTARSGVALEGAPIVELRDANDLPVQQAGVDVTVVLAQGAGTLSGQTTVATDDLGRAGFEKLTLTGTVGQYALRFQAAGLTDAVSGPILLSAGPAVELAVATQPSSAAVSGVALAVQPAVRLVDGAGNTAPEAGIVVTASLTGGGTLAGTVAIATGADGIATFTDLAITGPAGVYQLTFAADGLSGTVSTSITIGAGAADRLLLVTPPPSTAQNGVAFTQQPAIQVADEFNSPVTSTGRLVTAALASGAGALGGTLTATTDGAGRATFTDLAITGPPGSYTIAFSTPGLTGVTSGAITIVAGEPTQLTLIQEPSAEARSGIPLLGQPVVQIRDADGLAVPLAGVLVSGAIASGAGTLSGTAAVPTDSQGQAAFTDLAISGPVGEHTLEFTADGLAPVTSQPISLLAGPAARLGLVVPAGTSATSGIALDPQPQVQLYDEADNPAPEAGVEIVAVIASSPGGAPALTNVAAVTDATGLATFSDLTITGPAGEYVLRLETDLLPSILTDPITVSPGGASRLAIMTAPSSSAESGTPLADQPAIQVQDDGGNPVATGGLTVTAVFDLTPGGTPTLTNATALTDETGLATFSDLTITGEAGDYRLRFESVPLAPVTSETISLTTAPTVQLVFLTQPSSTAQSGVQLAAQPVIRTLDGEGQGLNGVPVTVAVAPAGSLSGTTTVTSGPPQNRAAFTNLAMNAEEGVYRLVFTADGALPLESGPITVSTGPATALFVTAQPGETSAEDGAPVVPQPVVEFRDSGGNLANTSASVTATLAPDTEAGIAIAEGGTVEAVNGVATFVNLTLTGTGTARIRFTSGSLTVDSAPFKVGSP